MYGYYVSNSVVTQLHEDDINGTQQLYGIPYIYVIYFVMPITFYNVRIGYVLNIYDSYLIDIL